MTEGAVNDWVASTLKPATWEVTRQLLESQTDDVLAEEPSAPAQAAAALPSSTAVTLLHKLKIASLDRIVREVTRVDSNATRASVISELESCQQVKWFGRSIVCARFSS